MADITGKSTQTAGTRAGRTEQDTGVQERRGQETKAVSTEEKRKQSTVQGWLRQQVEYADGQGLKASRTLARRQKHVHTGHTGRHHRRQDSPQKYVSRT